MSSDWSVHALVDGRLVTFLDLSALDYHLPAARIVSVGTLRGDPRVAFVNELGDAYERNLGTGDSRWLGSGIVDLADARALVGCDGRLAIDRTPIDGVADVVRVTVTTCGYLALVGDGTLFAVDGTTYTARALATGVTYLDSAGSGAVWVDASGGVHGDCDTTATLTGVRLVTPVFTVGRCFVRPDDTSGCTDGRGGTIDIALPPAVAHEAVQIVHGNEDSIGSIEATLFVLLRDGSVWSWAVHEPYPPTEPFRVTMPPRRVAGP